MKIAIPSKLMGICLSAAVAALAGCAHAPMEPVQPYVGVSCAALPATPGAPQLRDSLARLPGGVTLQILHGGGLAASHLMLPARAQENDEISYAWSERAEAAGEWRCELAWRYAAGVWQLQRLDARWNGASGSP